MRPRDEGFPFHKFEQYAEALASFEKAIAINLVTRMPLGSKLKSRWTFAQFAEHVSSDDARARRRLRCRRSV